MLKVSEVEKTRIRNAVNIAFADTENDLASLVGITNSIDSVSDHFGNKKEMTAAVRLFFIRRLHQALRSQYFKVGGFKSNGTFDIHLNNSPDSIEIHLAADNSTDHSGFSFSTQTVAKNNKLLLIRYNYTHASKYLPSELCVWLTDGIADMPLTYKKFTAEQNSKKINGSYNNTILRIDEGDRGHVVTITGGYTAGGWGKDYLNAKMVPYVKQIDTVAGCILRKAAK